jgi:RHS repeat-associated protein
LYGDRGEYNAGTVLAYSVDHLGSVRHVNNGTTGAWMLSLDYDAYGYPSASLCASAGCALTSDDRLSRYFAGLFVNGRTSLYLANYRAYSMETGRWLNRDPIEESGGLNLYAYADNQPIKYTDQSGLLPQCRLVAFEWICIEPPLVPIDPTDPVESRSRERKRAGTTAANVLEGIRNKVCPKLPQNRCEAREAEDNQICSGLTWIDGARRRCYASAAKRLAACEAGLPVEPLSW